MGADRRSPARRPGGILRGHGRRGLSIGFLAALFGVALFAPLIANDRPLVARVGGRFSFPALGDLFRFGANTGDFGRPEINWASPPPGVEVLLGTPLPWSYRGIRLEETLEPPGWRHLLGTDALGRDLLARLVHGARVSFLIGLGATLAAIGAGLVIGATAALRGGLVDVALVRLMDVFSCFPPFILALGIIAAGGRGGPWPVVAGIALNRWASMARYVRGEVIRQRSAESWEAARAAGAAGPRLLLRHVLPLLSGPLAVLGSFGVVHAIILESGLSFVGFGVDPPIPSWGAMLAESRATLDAAWWPVLAPAAALLLTLAALGAAADHAGETRSPAAPLL